MSEFDAIGGAAAGGLIAGAVEKPTGQAGEHHVACADCGTQTVGRFCHNCGNPSHVHRTLLHLGEELLHGVMHFDSRTWRTLPLLVFRPGKLTREWVHGKRTRYVSPLAVFLFTVFVIFMGLSYLPKPEATGIGEQAAAAAALAQRRTALANAEAVLAQATTASERNEAQGAVRDAQLEVQEMVGELNSLRTDGDSATDWKQKLAQDTHSGVFKINTGNKTLDEKIKHKLENPDLAIYKLQQTFYKFSFLLVPISIPFVALLFLWKPGFTLYDHGVFVLYSLTFMSLLILGLAGALRVGGLVESWAFAAAPFVIPAHMFFQLRGAYGLGLVATLWRTLVLLVFSAIALMLFILAILCWVPPEVALTRRKVTPASFFDSARLVSVRRLCHGARN